MTSPDEQTAAVPAERGALREAGGLLLLLIGLIGLGVVAYQVDPLLGLAYLSAVNVVLGLALTLPRT